MFTRKYALTQIFVLVLLLVSAFHIQSCTQRLASKPKDLFEMSLEELMEVEVIVTSEQSLKKDELFGTSHAANIKGIHYSNLTQISVNPWPVVGANIQKTNSATDFFEMSLEELMEIEITS